MRVLSLLLSFFLFLSSAFGGEVRITKKYYKSKGIEVEDFHVPSKTILSFKAKEGYDTEGLHGCSLLANYYGKLALNKNLKAVKELFEDWKDNWKDIALVFAIYAIATQLPYVKEALVSADFIQNFEARLGGFNCESTLRFIKRVSGVNEEAIERCLEEHKDECESSDDPSECFYKKCGVHKTWWELVTGKKFEEAVEDSSLLKKVGEIFAMINPKTTLSCALGLPNVPENMTKEQFDQKAKEISESTGIPELATKSLLVLLTAVPEVKITSDGMGLSIPKIDGKAMSITRGLELLYEDLEKDLDTLFSQLETAYEEGDEEKIKEEVEAFASKYDLKIDADSWFTLFYYVRKKLKEDCPNTLAGTYNVEEEQRACFERVTAFNQAKEIFAKIVAVKFALAVERAMLRYIDRTKFYLLQQKDTGVAVCKKIASVTGGEETEETETTSSTSTYDKLDLSEKNLKAMIEQLDTLKERVKTEVGFFLLDKEVDRKEISKLSLKVALLLGKAVDGKDHKEGDRIRFTFVE